MNEINKCDKCNGKIIKTKVDYILFGVNLGEFPAEVCTKCGEKLFSEETTDSILETAKKNGLWGLHSKSKVGIVGNSLDIKINKRIADFIGLKKGKEVEIYPEDKHKLVILL